MVRYPAAPIKPSKNRPIAEVRPAAEVSDETVSRLANVCRLLSEKSRLRMVFALSAGEMPVADLVALVGLSRGAVGNSLKLMRLAGLVRRRRQGKMQIYALAFDYFRDLFDRVFPLIARDDA